ncbi:hypothetical protein FAES_3228 [Fibrella aestuarina BUZ 2]|uniref:Glycosyl transferase family 9 n=1 Tax=Fibrella aestuarina BUZ 2 TaxID=1166018 RepID=I0KAT4_9BACT|nr:glycosyltransferase family 9 protein [Fibrella aestuarina]CCH01237.1 hypothetical protein FAES_3228 [Fibrella aestuarina BUZ 2]
MNLHLSADGLGDTICGVYAAAGIARHAPVTYWAKHPDWLGRISAPGVTIARHDERPGDSLDMNLGYGEQLRDSVSRKDWYVQQVMAQTGLVDLEASAGFHVDRRQLVLPELLQDKPPYVVLAPYSLWESRNWTEAGWAHVVTHLHRAGYEVLGLHTDEARLRRTFGSRINLLWGLSAPEVVDTLLGAAGVIGLDSGITHVAGMLGVPTVAVMAHLSVRLVFSHTAVQAVGSNACGYAPCGWQVDRGFSEACGLHGCHSLASTSASDVAAALLKLLPRR